MVYDQTHELKIKPIYFGSRPHYVIKALKENGSLSFEELMEETGIEKTPLIKLRYQLHPGILTNNGHIELNNELNFVLTTQPFKRRMIRIIRKPPQKSDYRIPKNMMGGLT